MNLKLLKEEDAPLFNRKVCYFEVEFPKQKTPTKTALKKDIAVLTKSRDDLVVIKNVKQNFGMSKAIITANIYKDLGDLKKAEEIKKRRKKEKKEKPEKEEKPAEEKKEVKPEVKHGEETKTKEQKTE